MKKKDIILDFTSLLDVVLIILFFFILFSHMEVEESKNIADRRMTEAESMISEANAQMDRAQEMQDQLNEELELISKSDKRKASNTEAMIDFGRSENVKMILHMKDAGWELNISRGDEIVAKVSSNTDICSGILDALAAAGCEPEDTLFCEFILNGSEPGTASAYRKVDKAIEGVRSTYKYLYYSETDLAIVEE